LETTALVASEDGALTARLVLPPRVEVKTERRAVAAWVTRRGLLTPLQAAGGWIE
jgi:hypothetical protein